VAKSKRASLLEHIAIITDPRLERSRLHSLQDVVVIALCGMICGADDWVSIEQFGKAKESWFRTFLDLPHGIPSHDTFGRIFAALDPEAFAQFFAAWVRDVAELTEGQVVAIDGKTIRRSFDRAGSRSAIHMVNAWATESGLSLGQVATDEKSNEITAVPRLLELLQLKGCIVTLDAMGCQKEIAGRIVSKGADYLLQVKGNQPQLHMELEAYFTQALKHDFADVPFDVHETTERGHGRRERRRTYCTKDISALSTGESWPGLKSIAMREAERENNGATSVERHYYISSLPGTDARKVARAAREHWAVENNLHWVLDIAFREDESRARLKNSAQNLSTLRQMSLNLLKSDKTAKLGVKNKRLKAGWDEPYLLRVLGINTTPPEPRRDPRKRKPRPDVNS
jgi:predicted transposase YbfD/YdcC